MTVAMWLARPRDDAPADGLYHLIAILIVLAAATLGLTGGLAIYAFVRRFGIPFLGMPRTRRGGGTGSLAAIPSPEATVRRGGA